MRKMFIPLCLLLFSGAASAWDPARIYCNGADMGHPSSVNFSGGTCSQSGSTLSVISTSNRGSCTGTDKVTGLTAAGGVTCGADIGAGAGAPTTATYITQTPDGTLSAEQALSLLGTGLMLNTTGTGVVSIYPGGVCTYAIESLSTSGVVTCHAAPFALNNTWTGNNTFSPAAGTAIVATGGAVNGRGVTAQGAGGGEGLAGTGGATAGASGVLGVGGVNGGAGVVGAGAVGYQGGYFIGDAAGQGIYAQGGATGTGIYTTGGVTSGHGIQSVGTGGGAGGYFNGGASSGFGVQAFGGAGAGSVGVGATGGGTNGAGVYGDGTGAGVGVRGTGGATGPGVVGVAGGAGAPAAGAIRLTPQAAPSGPSDGDTWVETGTDTFKSRINGGTKTVWPAAAGDLTGTISDAQLANNYSGIGACAAGRFASTLNDNAAPTCGQVAYADVSGTPTIPTDISAEQYWVGAASANLSAEKDLSALSTALVINTAGTPSAYAGTSCTNQFNRSLSATGAATCAGVGVTDFTANQGTTTKVLHGNAAGQPSWGAVVDGDITPAYSGAGLCGVSQWVTGLTRNAAPSCGQPDMADITGVASNAQLPDRLVRLTADYTNATTTLSNTALTWTSPASVSRSGFDCMLMVKSSTTTTGGQFDVLNGTAPTTITYELQYVTAAGTAPSTGGTKVFVTSVAGSTLLGPAATSLTTYTLWQLTGIIVHTSTASAVTIRGKAGAAGTLTVGSGSYCRYYTL